MKRMQVFGIGLLLLAGIALAWLLQGRGETTLPVVVKTRYLVAQHALKTGEFLEPADMDWKELDGEARERLGLAPQELVEDTRENREKLLNAIPRRNLAAGEYVREADLVTLDKPDFLPSVLRQGYRAFVIGVDDVTGGAGLFRPGNYVDVLFASAPKRTGANAQPAARTLLRGVRILAVNRDLGAGDDAARSKDDAARRKKDEKRDKKGTVTLEVRPKGAEILAVARNMGELSLILCSQGESDGGMANGGVTYSGEVLAGPTQRAAVEINQIMGTTQKTHTVQ